jgi:hypothetical protein
MDFPLKIGKNHHLSDKSLLKSNRWWICPFLREKPICGFLRKENDFCPYTESPRFLRIFWEKCAGNEIRGISEMGLMDSAGPMNLKFLGWKPIMFRNYT